ncbi:hypothetical protein CPC735_050690 [Coccidioides posadasii C735 delta SOWgp]|uniref:Reverse transcriptase domain-containing protein n=1 Tax=Coccidioides posadasii (strain C735) TaxID=222929 RepID=C5PGP6_COCP7|nr:hypothetical protein CPC735_050690 [Coccidioides posadasii C735 delta SOWgp]EER23699.1 hypothetical protein CPC735_050690 [Coccidioides posadasii C735 delta SOWgp]|eukprot:XP_003065844.1 hypothetical protein CPC735_050690 [Coccidioides posadasii C735 delta SOWgp]
MAASPSVLSQTLQSITTTKIEELEKQRQKYEETKRKILDLTRDAGDSIHKRISRLHAGVKELQLLPEAELENIDRWLHQSQYDPTIPESMLVNFESELRSRLDRQTRKLDLADLYSRLLIEWINSPSSSDGDAERLDSSMVDEDFDVVQDIQKEKLQQLREKFEKVVFEPLMTDSEDITRYLETLFSGDEGQDALKLLRETVKNHGKLLLSEKQPVERKSLKQCIQSLLKNDLLNDQKLATLGEFLHDDTVLDEIANVLNMRYANLGNWSWNVGGKGMPVLPRQSLNGKWRVMMDEDVLQALLTHYIGNKWCVFLKKSLHRVIERIAFWAKDCGIPEEDQALRRYYLNEGAHRWTVKKGTEKERHDVYKDHFFLAPMPGREFQDAVGYDDDGGSDDDDYDESTINLNGDNNLSPKEVKQLLLRTLATEVLMGRAFDGEVAVVQSDFLWFATSVSHNTIFAVLRFVGFEEEWINFFKNFLEPPLDMLTGDPIRIRRRGLPMAHIFEKVFGELILFFMDVAVSQQANILLYRFHDDLWLCGKPDSCAKAWLTMENFAKIMGLEFNKSKTGSVYLVEGGRTKKPEVVKVLPEGPVAINFLVLDPITGEWTINRSHVEEHVAQLSKQLNGAKSVLQWVKTWNSCIGRFFSYTFGEPSNCFGRKHLVAIFQTHQDIQSFLFNDQNGNGNSVVEHLKQMIISRFNVSDIPDAFLYMPEALGGLGLHNPFVPLSLVSPHVCEDPKLLIHAFLESEREAYNKAKREFENLTESERRKRFKNAFPRDEDTGTRHYAPATEGQNEFFSFEKYTQWRQYTNDALNTLYCRLNTVAFKKTINFSHAVRQELNKLSGPPANLKELCQGNIDPEMGWLIQFYSSELEEKCGGLSIVDRSFLPLGVLKAMRKKKVAWQMAL